MPDSFSIFFNNLSSCFLIGCYYTLSHYSVPREADPRPFVIKNREFRLVLITIVLVLIVPFVPHFLQFAFDIDKFMLGRFTPWVSAAIAGIATILLVERLGTRDIEAPLILILIMYLYGTVQFTWPFFTLDFLLATPDEALWLQFILTFVALIGKVTLFVVVIWIIDTNRLDFYMWRSRKSLDTVKSDREEFKTAFTN
jgi:hypothetical protein